MAEIRFTAAAEAALVAIVDYIAADNPAAAFDLLEDMETRVTATLSTFPEAGPVYRGVLRHFTIRSHTVIYRFDPAADTVFVLDVFGAGEDWR